MTREDLRQTIHGGCTLFALALRSMDRSGAMLLAGSAVALAWIAMPLLRWDRAIRRDGGPFVDGVKLYPLAVLGLVALLPLPQAAAAWGVLGIGDAASNVIGRRMGRPPFCGRGDRSIAGSLAFVVTGFAAAIALHAFVADAAPTSRVALACAAAAVAGAAAELATPRPLDDNLPIAAAAGAAMWLV